jgi:hypothetical protein
MKDFATSNLGNKRLPDALPAARKVEKLWQTAKNYRKIKVCAWLGRVPLLCFSA